VCDCQPNPVRDLLGKLSIGQVQSARDTALSRALSARSTGDSRQADVFAKVAEGCAQELEDRVLTIMTRDVVRASQEADRQARDLITQMTS
jgi:hypothetical protein